MGAWENYKDCCRAVAREDPEAAFCPVCRHVLLRCPAPGCRNLVTPLGHCGRCVDLHLSVEASAVLKARVGGCLNVSFVLSNGAAARSIAIKSVVRDATDLPREAVPVAWDQLEAGRERSFLVPTGPFAHGGRNALRLTIIAAAVFGDVEETYAFAGDVPIEVESAAPTSVVNTFDFSQATIAKDGRLVLSPTSHIGVSSPPEPTEPREVRRDVVVERAERHEIEQGCRGYEGLAARIPRDVEFVYVGFPQDDRPLDGPLRQQPVIRCGRNGRFGHVPQNVEPNDLCLRIYDARSGELDREASASISRHVCDFVVSNDRLNVRAVTNAGLTLNDARLAGGEMRVVSHGDALKVPAGRGKTLTIAVSFRVSAGLVTHVRLEKK